MVDVALVTGKSLDVSPVCVARRRGNVPTAFL